MTASNSEYKLFSIATTCEGLLRLQIDVNPTMSEKKTVAKSKSSGKTGFPAFKSAAIDLKKGKKRKKNFGSQNNFRSQNNLKSQKNFEAHGLGRGILHWRTYWGSNCESKRSALAPSSMTCRVRSSTIFSKFVAYFSNIFTICSTKFLELENFFKFFYRNFFKNYFWVIFWINFLN